MNKPGEPSAAAPVVECEEHHPGLWVPDIQAAVEFYTRKLGFKPGFTWGDPPELAGVNLGDVSIHLALGEPTPNRKGCAVYFVIGDADELYDFHRANGVTIVNPIGDRPYELRDYTIRDPYGYELGFGHRIYHFGAPVRIERVDFPLRLEKRLAALVRDLAAHKGMTLSSCFEEILLHTCEPLGEGVASPHTRATLRHIQELKRKHGIDYDCHASYRFIE